MLNSYCHAWLRHERTEAIRDFYPKLKCAISLLDSLQNDKPNENIFYYHNEEVFHAHLLSNFGAAGETEKELKHVLGLEWA